MIVLAGLGLCSWRGGCRRGPSCSSIAFGPYEIFHLLFHETATMRYGLPLVGPAAFLVTFAAAGLGRMAIAATAIS